MSEKRVYQEKMLNSKKEIIICNWERGDGKTYSIYKKIIENAYNRRLIGRSKFLYISPFEAVRLQDCFKEFISDFKEDIKLYKTSKNEIFIEMNNGNILEILCYRPNCEPRAMRNIKFAFFDEYYPNKEYIDSIIRPKDVEQIYIMMTNDNLEYIDSRNSTKLKDFYDNQIEELMIEFSNIVKNEKTTLTRENILKQIKVLQDMKRVNKPTN